jgi:catechol 2,3-dioxygenase-like lactoylglutathione lyase family enzyme
MSAKLGVWVEQRLSVVTLGVRDLARARAFYTDLNWAELQPDQPEIAFFQLNGFVLALYPLVALAEDACVPAGEGFGGVTLAINVGSPAEVDATLNKVLACGARLLKPAQRVFWGGYHGYFADPDGHVWEVAHNPSCTIHEDGRTTFRSSVGEVE